MIRKRQITGTFYLANGKPAAGKPLKIELCENDYTLDGSIQRFEIVTILDADGAIPQIDSQNNPDPFLLWCNADGFIQPPLKFTEPDGTVWYALLEYGDGSPLNKDSLRAGGAVVDAPETVNSLIALALGNYYTKAEVDAFLGDIGAALDAINGE
ncbi:MAG: hypothetical protein KIS76_03795 [Pyrinomonadaceae bacterium]|nr:hypothetical protein [Pyrinomonadaceae bacterium]